MAMSPAELPAKPPRASAVETRYIIMPQHANDYGIAFGGTIMSWIDMVAAMVAQRHAEREVVTVSIDKISFLAPIELGDHVVLKASVNYVGRTSMEVGVQVTKENPYTGRQERATTAYLTFVGLDDQKHPVPVPKIVPETPNEVRRFENAKLRVQTRQELLQKLRLAEPKASDHGSLELPGRGN
jgi:acyl-CoA hydrolase